MSVRHSGSRIGPTAASILVLLPLAGPASAQSARHECSAKYQAAKSAGTLLGQTWPQFFSRCMVEAKQPITGPQSAPSAAAPPAVMIPPAPVIAPATEPDGEPLPPGLDPTRPLPAPAPAVTTGEPQPVAASPGESDVDPASPIADPLEPLSPPVAPVPAETAAPEIPSPAPEKAPAVVKEPSGSPVFPSIVAPTYAKETPAAARKKTCLDQFNANKASNANGGLGWIQKGGGYFSLCNKHLKGGV